MNNSNQHPFLSRTIAYITYEEIYGDSISYEELVGMIESLPIDYWIGMASKGRILLEHYENEHKYQHVLFDYFCPKSLLETPLNTYDSSKRHFFHRTQFLALLKLALLHGRSHETQTIDDELRRDTTARCLLGISSLLYRKPIEQGKYNVDNKTFWNKLTFDTRKQFNDSEKHLIMDFLHAYYLNLRENLANITGRYKIMLLDIPSDPNFKPEGVPSNLLSDVLMNEMNLTAEQYAALTFGILAKYVPPEGIFKSEFYFPINRKTHFSKSAIDQRAVDEYFSSVSQSRSEFVEWQNSQDNYPGEMDDFRAFMLKPLVYLDGNDDYWPSSLIYLQRLLESGLIWVVRSGEFMDTLHNYWGQVSEFYCHKICERIATNSIIRPSYIRSTEYGPPHNIRKSCDAILVYGRIAVMLEFKIKMPRLMNTIIEKDYDSFINDIIMTFVGDEKGDKAAKQIDETIKAIRKGDLKLPGIGPHTIQDYYPVVVTLNSWPLGPFVYDLIRRTIRAKHLLQQNRIAALEIWNCEEFEYIEALLASGKHGPIDMPSIIREKSISEYKNIPMSIYLGDRYPEGFPNNVHIESAIHEMTNIIEEELKLAE